MSCGYVLLKQQVIFILQLRELGLNPGIELGLEKKFTDCFGPMILAAVVHCLGDEM